MPRDGSGIYTLPPSNPVVDGTIIDVDWANPTMADIALQLNNVYTRDGTLGPTGPFRVLDGSVSNPGLAFQNETQMGWYRPGPNVNAFAVAGKKIYDWTSAAFTTMLQMWPRTDGDSRIVLYAKAQGSPDLRSTVIRTDDTVTTIGAYGSTGADLRDLNVECSNMLVYGNVIASSAPGAYYGFGLSNTRWTRLNGLELEDYDTAGGDQVVILCETHPFGKECGMGFYGRGPSGADVDGVIRSLLANFMFRTNHEAYKTGGTAYWQVPSNRDLKHDIEDNKAGMAEIRAIRPRKFRYNIEPNRQQFGIIEDEIIGVMPETISQMLPGIAAFDTGPVFWATVNAVKELDERLSKLEALTP